MKIRKWKWAPAARALGAGSAIAAIMALAAWRVWGTPPGLSIALTSTNTVALTVTNGTPSGTYEIWWSEFLDPNGSFTNGDWTLLEPGSTGQTNFGPYDITELWTGFFRAVGTNDVDGDAALDYQDSRPFDPSIGILRVTIEAPANGSTVQ
jgi:hypothetical protein